MYVVLLVFVTFAIGFQISNLNENIYNFSSTGIEDIIKQQKRLGAESTRASFKEMQNDIKEIGLEIINNTEKTSSINFNKISNNICDASKICDELKKNSHAIEIYSDQNNNSIFNQQRFEEFVEIIQCTKRDLFKIINEESYKFDDSRKSEYYTFRIEDKKLNSILNKVFSNLEEFKKILFKISTNNFDPQFNLINFLNSTILTDEINPDEKFELIKYFTAWHKDTQIENSWDMHLINEYLSGYTPVGKLEKFSFLFSESQNNIIKFLETIKKNSSQTQQIDKMVEIVKTIKLDQSDTMTNSDLCISPNAFYLPTAHSLTICPSLLSYPEDTILMILGHEIGHSIDPCVLSFVAASLGKKTIIPVDKSVFKNQIQCLRSQNSINARFNQKDLQINSLNNSINELKIHNAPQDVVNKFQDLKEYVEKLDSSISCNSTNEKPAQISEAFADWISTEAIGLKFKQNINKSKNKESAILHSLYFTANRCPIFPLKLSDESKLKLKKWNCGPGENVQNQYLKFLAENQSHTMDSHPKDFDRINKILMTHPEFKKYLSCNSSSIIKYCPPPQ